MLAPGIRQGHPENNEKVSMDKSLIEDIEKTISREKMQCNFIADDQAAQLIQTLAAKFSFDTNQLFMWSNRKFSEAHSYQGDPNRWEPLMEALLGKFNEQLFLVVTDEEYFPWNVLKCSKDACIKLLKAQRYFEYFIFDASMGFVLFDTHDNSFILFRSASCN